MKQENETQETDDIRETKTEQNKMGKKQKGAETGETIIIGDTKEHKNNKAKTEQVKCERNRKQKQGTRNTNIQKRN